MKTIKTILVAAVISGGMHSGSAQMAFANDDNVANDGYDMVNYFSDNSAKQGSKEFVTTHAGVSYYFLNSDNLKKFKKNPEQYLPQFDGYCSFAVAKMNKKVPVNPKTFRVNEGKLYLFFNDLYEGEPFDTSVPWMEKEAEMKKMAEKNWQAMKDKS